jgi:hypothetical protein
MSTRKHESGFQKRKKKQRIEKLVQSQKGDMDRFVFKEPQVSSVIESANQPADLEPATATNNIGDNVVEDVPIDSTNIPASVDVNVNMSPDGDVSESFQPDIFDPRYWDSLNPRQIDILAEKGSRRDLLIQKGPKDKFFRRFSALFYNRVLSNGELCDRDWLVYSKELDRVFCFGCKLFTKGYRKGLLANQGYNDWLHLANRLKEHETSADHVLSMTTWYELHNRLQKNQTIDKDAQRQLEK